MQIRRLLAPSAALILALTLSAPAFAGFISPGTYVLFDHGDGALGPAYGLRVDSIGEVFSVEIGGVQTLLSWDGGTTATISGTLNRNTLGGNGGVGEVWDVDFQLTGVSAVGTLGFTATAGSGTLTDPLDNVIPMTGEQNGSGFAFEFLADGHRIDGDDDTPVGRGWILPPGSVDDWIVRAAPLPEPAGLALVAAGLALLALRRR